MAVSSMIEDIGREIERRTGLFVNFGTADTGATVVMIAAEEISQVRSMTFRTAEESQNKKVVKFVRTRRNPRGPTRCRVPQCELEAIERDAFVCYKHRSYLKDLILKLCAEENVDIDLANYTYEDFDRYINLILLLDEAFKHAKSLSRESTDVAEVLLNTRNMLIAANALLHPEEDHDATAFLASFFVILKKFLHHPLPTLHKALRKLVTSGLQYFGIDYSWVQFHNPGSRIGAGIGLLLGYLGSWWFASSVTGILATCVVCFFAGNLIGGGSYDWNRVSCQYRLFGTPDGDLILEGQAREQ